MLNIEKIRFHLISILEQIPVEKKNKKKVF